MHWLPQITQDRTIFLGETIIVEPHTGSLNWKSELEVLYCVCVFIHHVGGASAAGTCPTISMSVDNLNEVGG